MSTVTSANFGMDTITMRELPTYLYYVTYTRRRPVMLWGVMGVGKSAAVIQFASWIKGVLVDIRLGQYESIDLRGLPDVNKENGTTTWYVPATLPFKGNPLFDEKGPPIILFLDEINAATRGVAGVAYQLIRDRRVGEHELMDNVIVIAAGNRESDRGVTERQPAPLSNRFNHVEVVPDVASFRDYVIDKSYPVEVTGFLSWMSDMLCTFDPAKNDKAFATPRSIEEALLDQMAQGVPEELRWRSIAGWVGTGWATAYRGYLDVYQTMKAMMPAIMADPDRAPLPEKPDQSYAIVSSIGGQLDKSNANVFWRYVKRMPVEFAILTWQLALKRDGDLDQTPEFIEYGRLHREVLQGR